MKDTCLTLTQRFPNLFGYISPLYLTPSNILQNQHPGNYLRRVCSVPITQHMIPYHAC